MRQEMPGWWDKDARIGKSTTLSRIKPQYTKDQFNSLPRFQLCMILRLGPMISRKRTYTRTLCYRGTYIGSRRQKQVCQKSLSCEIVSLSTVSRTAPNTGDLGVLGFLNLTWGWRIRAVKPACTTGVVLESWWGVWEYWLTTHCNVAAKSFGPDLQNDRKLQV